MTTAKMTLGAMFGAITNTADSVSNTFGTINTAVNMANAYVRNAAAKQTMDNKVDQATYKKKLIEQVSLEETERRIAIEDFTSKSARHQELFQTAMDDISKILQD
jgi:hypothetical protein